jgi:hypothetical protein
MNEGVCGLPPPRRKLKEVRELDGWLAGGLCSGTSNFSRTKRVTSTFIDKINAPNS